MTNQARKAFHAFRVLLAQGGPLSFLYSPFVSQAWQKPKKRRSLFTKYEFEIRVVTLSIYLCLLIIGLVLFETRVGQAFAVLGFVGTLPVTISLIRGYNEITW